MPLSCDCYGGCWGVHARDWPVVQLTPAQRDLGKRPGVVYTDHLVIVAVALAAKLPYGTYVNMGNGEVRIETEQLRASYLTALEHADQHVNDRMMGTLVG